MAKKTKKSAENIAAQTAAPAVETTPTVTPKLIVAQRKFNRWYVYFKGVAPKDNVGCGCKTAKSAIRYMHLLKPSRFTTMQREYTCYTTSGKWNFYADDDLDSIRLSLFYCWRDGENFVRVERRQGAEHYTLRISHIDHNSHETFTL